MLFEEVKSENATEYTVPMGKVNGMALLMLIPILIVFLLPFLLIWDFESLKIGYKAFLKSILFILVGGIIIHELLHGLTWAVFVKGGFRQLKFGINWRYLAPYAHFKKPLKVKIYLAGALMPLLILGIIPAVGGIISGNGFFLLFGIFFTWAAAGDILASIRLFQLPMNVLVQDHPEKLGFIIFK
jgi:hypothetical protein